jgi:hypothetical protein
MRFQGFKIARIKRFEVKPGLRFWGFVPSNQDFRVRFKDSRFQF